MTKDTPKGLDLKLMQEAFDRAAYIATHGTQEERAGKFRLDSEPYTTEEIEGFRRQLRTANKSARKAVKERGITLHPRLAGKRLALLQRLLKAAKGG